jgi:hypothetical protein
LPASSLDVERHLLANASPLRVTSGHPLVAQQRTLSLKQVGVLEDGLYPTMPGRKQEKAGRKYGLPVAIVFGFDNAFLDPGASADLTETALAGEAPRYEVERLVGALKCLVKPTLTEIHNPLISLRTERNREPVGAERLNANKVIRLRPSKLGMAFQLFAQRAPGVHAQSLATFAKRIVSSDEWGADMGQERTLGPGR